MIILVLAIRTLHGIRDNINEEECPQECLCYKIKLLKVRMYILTTFEYLFQDLAISKFSTPPDTTIPALKSGPVSTKPPSALLNQH